MSGAAVAVVLVVGALSLTFPGFLSRDYDAKSLASLRKQAVRTRQGFASLLASLESRKARFDGTGPPRRRRGLLPLFREAGLDTATEGIALSNGDGFFEVWYGNVLSLADQVGERTSRPEGGRRLDPRPEQGLGLSHRPPAAGRRRAACWPTSPGWPSSPSSNPPTSAKSHALRPRLAGRLRHRLLGLPRGRRGVREVLRPAPGRVHGPAAAEERDPDPLLPAPERDRAHHGHRDAGLAVADLPAQRSLGKTSGSFSCSSFSSPGSRPSPFSGPRPISAGAGTSLSGLAGALLLVGLRIVALPLGQLERVQSLRLFKPSRGRLRLLGGLTQSPADIFLTALTVLGLAACLAVCVPRPRRGEQVRLSVLGRVLIGVAAAGPRRGRPPRPPRARPPGRLQLQPLASPLGLRYRRAWPCSSGCSCSWSPFSSPWPSSSGWPSRTPGQDLLSGLAVAPGAAAGQSSSGKALRSFSWSSARPSSPGSSPSPSSPGFRGGARSGSPGSSSRPYGSRVRSTA